MTKFIRDARQYHLIRWVKAPGSKGNFLHSCFHGFLIDFHELVSVPLDVQASFDAKVSAATWDHRLRFAAGSGPI